MGKFLLVSCLCSYQSLICKEVLANTELLVAENPTIRLLPFQSETGRDQKFYRGTGCGPFLLGVPALLGTIQFCQIST
jgi:hypothetical protein